MPESGLRRTLAISWNVRFRSTLNIYNTPFNKISSTNIDHNNNSSKYFPPLLSLLLESETPSVTDLTPSVTVDKESLNDDSFLGIILLPKDENKKIYPNNTITNIVNADIKSSAAIEFSKMENLTNSRALVSDSSGDVSVSAVTATEIGHLDGVSSNVQTQLDTKTTAAFAIAQAIALG